MASKRAIRDAKRQVYGWMGMAMFGCHCGEKAPGQKYEGDWIVTHLARAHPELLKMRKLMTEKYVFSIRER
jgi:hypothetical protein